MLNNYEKRQNEKKQLLFTDQPETITTFSTNSDIQVQSTAPKVVSEAEISSKSVSILLNTNHLHVNQSTIKEIINNRLVPFKFRCRAQVIGCKPENVKDFCRPICPRCSENLAQSDSESDSFIVTHDIVKFYYCQACSITNIHNPQFVYAVDLLLKDETGTLDVILYKEDAEIFFKEAACDLYNSKYSEVVKSLQSKIDKLLNNENMIDCCIKSYFVAKKESIKYRIFDTSLKK